MIYLLNACLKNLFLLLLFMTIKFYLFITILMGIVANKEIVLILTPIKL